MCLSVNVIIPNVTFVLILYRVWQSKNKLVMVLREKFCSLKLRMFWRLINKKATILQIEYILMLIN